MRALRRVAGAVGLASRRGGQAALAVALAACAGDRIVVGERRPPVLVELAPADAGARQDGGAPTGGIGTPASCPESPAERRGVLGCWPTRHVGLWRGFWLGVPRYETAGGSAELPPGDVVMRFGLDGAGWLQVGGGASSAPAACGVGADAGACVAGELLAGFAYSLEHVRLSDAGEPAQPRVLGEAPTRRGELLEFELRLGEPWQPWCDGAGDACAGGACPAGLDAAETELARARRPASPATITCWCGDGRCVPQAPSLALALTMSADGLALRGTYRPRDPSLSPVSLELSRAEAP